MVAPPAWPGLAWHCTALQRRQYNKQHPMAVVAMLRCYFLVNWVYDMTLSADCHRRSRSQQPPKPLVSLGGCFVCWAINETPTVEGSACIDIAYAAPKTVGESVLASPVQPWWWRQCQVWRLFPMKSQINLVPSPPPRHHHHRKPTLPTPEQATAVLAYSIPSRFGAPHLPILPIRMALRGRRRRRRQVALLVLLPRTKPRCRPVQLRIPVTHIEPTQALVRVLGNPGPRVQDEILRRTRSAVKTTELRTHNVQYSTSTHSASFDPREADRRLTSQHLCVV